MPNSNPIDIFYMMMYKQILGVQKQTTNIGVLLELGKTPINLEAIKLAIKNWERIRLSQANELLIESYNNSMSEMLEWTEGIKRTLEINGLLCFYHNRYNNKPYVYNIALQRLKDQFHQNAFESINREDSKLRTYALFKNKIGLEPYLKMKSPERRSTIAKFRLSNHDLMIEIGRHRKIPKHFRFCPFCPDTTENELHFLLHCPMYENLRCRLLNSTNTTHLHNCTPMEKFYSLTWMLTLSNTL